MVGVRPRTNRVSLTLVPISQSAAGFDGKGQVAAEPSLALRCSSDLPKPETQWVQILDFRSVVPKLQPSARPAL